MADATGIATQSQIEKLVATGDNYDRWMTYLASVRPQFVGTPVLAQIDKALASGEATRATITGVMQKARDLWQWTKEQGAGAWDYLKSLVGLEGLPLIAAAWLALGATAVTGAVYTMNNWINTEAVKAHEAILSYRADVQAQIDAGIAPDVAVANANKSAVARSDAAAREKASGDTTGKALTLAKWALVGFFTYKGAKALGWIK